MTGVYQIVIKKAYTLFCFLPLLLALAFLQGCAKNPVTGERDFVLMSEEQEIALGRENHQKVIEAYGVYEDPQMQQYVQRIGEQLAAKSHRSNLYYRFTLLDSNEVNAFALPGGYIYITRGILSYLNKEEQMAAILGHEIAHVTARHTVQQHSTSTVTGLLGAIIGARTGSSAAQDLTNILGTALVRGYGREHELEADRLGAEYLAKAGYDPNAMLDVIRVLKDQELFEKQLAKEENREPNIYHGVFSTHPANDKRLQEVVKKAESLTTPGMPKGQSREDFLAKLDGMVFGDSAKEGIRRGNRFYHKPLNFAVYFPEGWKVKNSPAALIAQAPGNTAMIQMTAADLNRKIPPREFIEQRLKVGELSNGAEIRPSGLEGYTGIANANTPYGSGKARISVIYHNQKAFVFAAAAKENLLQYDPLILDTLKPFHPLTQEELSLAEPQHLQVVEAQAGTSFNELARESRIPNHPEAQLRLLNGFYPEGQPPAGMSIKVVK